jgi:hypothetical protein
VDFSAQWELADRQEEYYRMCMVKMRERVGVWRAREASWPRWMQWYVREQCQICETSVALMAWKQSGLSWEKDRESAA